MVVSKDSEAVKKKIVNAGGNFADSGEEFYPKSVYDALHILKDDYKVDIPVIIAENGCRDVSEKKVDGKNTRRLQNPLYPGVSRMDSQSDGRRDRRPRVLFMDAY